MGRRTHGVGQQCRWLESHLRAHSHHSTRGFFARAAISCGSCPRRSDSKGTIIAITRVALANNTFIAVNEDIPALKQQIESACHSNGAFVDISLAGNRVISVLITSSSLVSFEEVETVADDSDDDIDVTAGYVTDTDYWFE